MRYTFVLAFICPFFSSNQPLKAQQAPSPAISHHSPLSIGDTLPAGTLKPKHPTPNPKLLILEFFATWCTSCVKALPLSDSLQQAYNGRLQFLLVATTTSDNEASVRAFFSRHKRPNGTAYPFPTVVNDTRLHNLFPHTAVPHYVWLEEGRRVLAITDGDELTRENIEAALGGRPLHLTLKNDFPDYQPTLPLLVAGNGGTHADLQFGVTLTGYLPNLGTAARYTTDSLSRRLTLLNHSLPEAYQFALGFPANRVILETSDTARFFNTGVPAAQWKAQLHCIELTVPATAPPAELRTRLHRFLNAAFCLNGRIERRRVACRVLTATGPLPPTRGGKPYLRWAIPGEPLTCLQNAPLSRLVEALNSQLIGLPLLPIVVDESGITANVDLELAAPISDLPALRRELQRYGLDLVPAERELDMFVLSDDPHPNPATNK